MAGVVLVTDSPLQGLLLRRQLVATSPSGGLSNIQVKMLDEVIRDTNAKLGLDPILLPSDSALDAASYSAMQNNKTLSSKGSEALTTATEISSVFKSLRYVSNEQLGKLLQVELSETQTAVIESVLGAREILESKLGISNFSAAITKLISTIQERDFASKELILVITSTLPRLAEEFLTSLGKSKRFIVDEFEKKVDSVELFITAPDPQTEAALAVSQVAAFAKKGTHPFDIAVIYSDSKQYARFLASAFDDAGIIWHGAIDSISQTSGIYRGFDLILQMLNQRTSTNSGAERALVMRLLESGDFFVDGMRLEAELCRKFVRDKELYGDAVEWLKVIKKVADPANKRDAKALEELKALLKTLQKSLAKMASSENWTEFGQELFAVIESFYLGANEDNLSDEEKKVVSMFRQVLLQELPELDEVVGAGKSGLRPTAEAAQDFLERKIGTKNVRHGSLNVGVHVSGIEEARVLNFEKIILVGATEGFLPGPATTSAFLTEEMLEHVGELGQGAIASSDQGKVLGLNLLALLGDKSPVITRSRAAMVGKLDNVTSRFIDVESVKTKHVSVSSMNEFVRENSHFPLVSLRHLEIVEHGASGQELSYEESLILEALKIFRSPANTGYFGVVNNFDDKLSISNKFLSASAIEGFMNCEYKFFVTKILGIYTGDREDKLSAWRAKDFGNLIHYSMESFLNDLDAENELPDGESGFSNEQINLYFSKYLKEGLEDFYAKGHDAWRAGFEAHMTRVERNLRDFFKNEFTKVRREGHLAVYAAELAFGHEKDDKVRVTLDVPGRPGVKFAGRIDRVDLSADGKNAGVLDFKSGKYSNKVETSLGKPLGPRSPNRGQSMRTKVQDLVYLMAVKKRYPNLEKVDVNFAYIATGSETNFVPAAWMDDAEGQLAKIIETIYAAQDKGEFVVSHDSAISEHTLCDTCQRLGWVAEQLRLAGSVANAAMGEDGSDD
ncbi:MAG: PD-(D/E)XK nuclease family protein [Microbacteriaceae bacterium]|nr:PD-(D/E)XK nuclease family protein [Microbacteriaceae bacterium]